MHLVMMSKNIYTKRFQNQRKNLNPLFRTEAKLRFATLARTQKAAPEATRKIEASN